jgi:hypothetical protein
LPEKAENKSKFRKFRETYRKLPLKNPGDTLKVPDGTFLLTAIDFLTVAHGILYFEIKSS